MNKQKLSPSNNRLAEIGGDSTYAKEGVELETDEKIPSTEDHRHEADIRSERCFGKVIAALKEDHCQITPQIQSQPVGVDGSGGMMITTSWALQPLRLPE